MKRFFVLGGLVCLTLSVVAIAQDWRSGIPWEKPAVVTPGETCADAPSDAKILFDGTDLSAWEGGNWDVTDGIITVKPKSGDLRTKEKFGSVQLHLEFATPDEVSGTGQGRGNSGLFFMDHYEVQILDSYDCETYFDGQCASIYKQFPPYVNACKKPGEWQTYDVIFTRPELKIENGKVVDVLRPAYVTVFQNGVLVQNHWAIEGDTFFHQKAEYQPHGEKESIRLQDHGNKMRFRNIWVREIPDTNVKPAPTREPFFN